VVVGAIVELVDVGREVVVVEEGLVVVVVEVELVVVDGFGYNDFNVSVGSSQLEIDVVKPACAVSQ
jgi:hypothetical protein